MLCWKTVNKQEWKQDRIFIVEIKLIEDKGTKPMDENKDFKL